MNSPWPRTCQYWSVPRKLVPRRTHAAHCDHVSHHQHRIGCCRCETASGRLFALCSWVFALIPRGACCHRCTRCRALNRRKRDQVFFRKCLNVASDVKSDHRRTAANPVSLRRLTRDGTVRARHMRHRTSSSARCSMTETLAPAFGEAAPNMEARFPTHVQTLPAANSARFYFSDVRLQPNGFLRTLWQGVSLCSLCSNGCRSAQMVASRWCAASAALFKRWRRPAVHQGGQRAA